MPFDPSLAKRLRPICEKIEGMEEKKMFGGIGYLLKGKMCVGIYKKFLVIRVGVETAEALLKKKEIRPMDITGKPMKGWAMVAPAGMATDKELKKYVALSVAFVQENCF